MNAEQLRDLRAFLLRELYRVQPRGRGAKILCSLASNEVRCELADVESQLAFLQGEDLVMQLPADKLAPGLDRFWAITSAGMRFAEGERIV